MANAMTRPTRVAERLMAIVVTLAVSIAGLVVGPAPAQAITASTILTRAQSWVDARVPYSQQAYYSNQYGRYRQDCSGYVSMAWGLGASLTTWTLPSVATRINKGDLQAGDVMLNNRAADPDYQHVVLFDQWADAAHTKYWAYEQAFSPGYTVRRVIPYPYFSGYDEGSYLPYRYNGYEPPVVASSPFGFLDEASSPAAGVLRVRGWSADPDVPTQSIDVHVYANATGFNLGPANQRRDDVAGAYPGYGSNHGFSADLSLSAGGMYKVCAYGINIGGGSDQPLRDCKQVQVSDPQPFGYLDQVSSSTAGKVTVRGLAVDPSSPRSSIDVHAYMDQKFIGATKANQRRDDVDKALSGYGALHGYNATFAAAPGTHRVCTYAINIGVGDNRELRECKSVTVTAPTPPVRVPSPAPIAAAPGSLTTSRFRCPRRGVAILSWAPPANATSYRFRISWPNRSKKWTGWTTTSNAWMKVTRLHRGAKYRFQVQALSGGGQSAVKQWWFVQRR